MSQATIETFLPIDNSLTCQLIHEGLLYIIRESNATIEENMRVKVTGEALRTIFGLLKEDRINNIRISMAKNDLSPINRFITSLGIESNRKVTNYADLLRTLRENDDKLPAITNKLSLILRLGKNGVFLGEINKKDEGFALQLFKLERYMGITSTELNFTSKQLGTYHSRDVLLLALLGIYSSFVTHAKNYYYFLFFDPSEVAGMLRGEYSVEQLFLLKDEVREELARVIKMNYKEELLLCELAVNSTIKKLFEYHNITSLSLVLARIALEKQRRGRLAKTYKIYQLMPITVYRGRYGEVYRIMGEVLSPEGIVLRRLNRPENPEYQNLISAINGAYRFIVLGDVHGLYLLYRELLNSANKMEVSKPAERKIAKEYIKMAHRLSNLEVHV